MSTDITWGNTISLQKQMIKKRVVPTEMWALFLYMRKDKKSIKWFWQPKNNVLFLDKIVFLEYNID